MSTETPSCDRHDENPDLEECAACIAWYDAQDRYWSAYFGGPSVIKAQLATEKFYRDEFGIDINDPSPETADALRRLK